MYAFPYKTPYKFQSQCELRIRSQSLPNFIRFPAQQFIQEFLLIIAPEFIQWYLLEFLQAFFHFLPGLLQEFFLWFLQEILQRNAFKNFSWNSFGYFCRNSFRDVASEISSEIPPRTPSRFFWNSLRDIFLKFFLGFLPQLFLGFLKELLPGLYQISFLGFLQEFLKRYAFRIFSWDSLWSFARDFFRNSTWDSVKVPASAPTRIHSGIGPGVHTGIFARILRGISSGIAFRPASGFFLWDFFQKILQIYAFGNLFCYFYRNLSRDSVQNSSGILSGIHPGILPEFFLGFLQEMLSGISQEMLQRYGFRNSSWDFFQNSLWDSFWKSSQYFFKN